MPVTHVTPAGGNVFADLGFSKDEAEALKICSSLMMKVQDVIEERELSTADAAKLFGVTQARIKALLRGKIGEFTIDALVRMLTHAGMRVEVSVKAVA
ncbi:MAG TPA: helix-turn-helix transcriptional regulator [Longimicrobium sp.]